MRNDGATAGKRKTTVIRLKLDGDAETALQRCGLTTDDLLLLLALGRRRRSKQGVWFSFDAGQIPEGLEPQLRHLIGARVLIAGGRLIEAFSQPDK